MISSLQRQQYNDLWVSTEDNPLLKESNIPSKNKALKTKSKRIIGAINEILERFNDFKAYIQNYLKRNDEIVSNISYKLKTLDKRVYSLNSKGEGETLGMKGYDLGYHRLVDITNNNKAMKENFIDLPEQIIGNPIKKVLIYQKEDKSDEINEVFDYLVYNSDWPVERNNSSYIKVGLTQDKRKLAVINTKWSCDYRIVVFV